MLQAVDRVTTRWFNQITAPISIGENELGEIEQQAERLATFYPPDDRPLGRSIQAVLTHLPPADQRRRAVFEMRQDQRGELLDAIKELRLHLEPRRFELQRQDRRGRIDRFRDYIPFIPKSDPNSQRRIANELSEAIAHFWSLLRLPKSGELPLQDALILAEELAPQFSDNPDLWIDPRVRAALDNFTQCCPRGESIEPILAPIQVAHQQLVVDAEGIHPSWPESTSQQSIDFFNSLAHLRLTLRWAILHGNEQQPRMGQVALLEEKIDQVCSELAMPTAQRAVELMTTFANRRQEVLMAQSRLPQVAQTVTQEVQATLNATRGQLLDRAIEERTVLIIRERRNEMWRSLAAFGAFAIIAIHSPLHNRPRTFLFCAAATATIAAWGSGSEGVLNVIADEAHNRMKEIVRDHFQDKALSAFLLLFPTLWILVKLPIIGRIISAASSVGVAGLFGIKLWEFQKRHFSFLGRQEAQQRTAQLRDQMAQLIERLPQHLHRLSHRRAPLFQAIAEDLDRLNPLFPRSDEAYFQGRMAQLLERLNTAFSARDPSMGDLSQNLAELRDLFSRREAQLQNQMTQLLRSFSQELNQLNSFCPNRGEPQTQPSASPLPLEEAQFQSRLAERLEGFSQELNQLQEAPSRSREQAREGGQVALEHLSDHLNAMRTLLSRRRETQHQGQIVLEKLSQKLNRVRTLLFSPRKAWERDQIDQLLKRLSENLKQANLDAFSQDLNQLSSLFPRREETQERGLAALSSLSQHLIQLGVRQGEEIAQSLQSLSRNISELTPLLSDPNLQPTTQQREQMGRLLESFSENCNRFDSLFSDRERARPRLNPLQSLDQLTISRLGQVHRYAPLVVRFGKLAIFGGFLLIYPMTTNSHLSTVTALVAATFASTSKVYQKFVSERNVDLASLVVVAIAAVGSIFFLPGFGVGYVVGKYIHSPLHVDLDQICGVVDRIAGINKLIAVIGGVAAGNSLWAVQQDLFERRTEGEVGSPLDPLRGWMERFEFNWLDQLRGHIEQGTLPPLPNPRLLVARLRSGRGR